MKIKCEEANAICDRSQYHECSKWQRLKLEWHLLFCKSCRAYSKGNAKLTKMIQSQLDLLPKGYPKAHLDTSAKEAMQKKMDAALQKD